MKLLGIDFGTHRIGLALGDSENKLTFPIISLEVAKADVVSIIKDMIKEDAIETVVIGMPYSLTPNGSKGATEHLVEAFMAKLAEQINVPIVTEDERFSSAYADRVMRESGGGDRDAIAAAAILEAYINRMF